MKALLVIDMLNDFIKPEGALYIGSVADQLVPAVKERLKYYRQQQLPVIYVCDRHYADDHEFNMFPPHALEGEDGGEVIETLEPLAGEKVIYKRRFSAFFGTDLDLTLRELGIKEVELAGCVTNICVLYTAADARMLNYAVTVNQLAVNGFDPEAHRFALQEMQKTLGVNIF